MPFPAFVFISILAATGVVVATTALSPHRDRAALVAAVGAGLILLFHGLGFFRIFLDDAYIGLRYSRNFADGVGPVWNPGEHVEGYTSFSWMAILAGMAKLGFDLVLAARLLAILAFVATFFSLYRIWTLWADEDPDSGIGHPLVFAIPLLGVALADGPSYWGLSGMETPLFMAMIASSAYLYLRERRAGGFPYSAIAVAATAMTRPEGILVAGVTGAFVGLDALRASDRNQALQRAALWGGLLAVLFGSYFAWRWTYYGYFFPNTFYAKVGPSSEIYNRGLGYVETMTLNYHLLPMYGGIVLLTMRTRLRWDAIYILTLTAALILAFIPEGGDGFGHGRFVAPVLPLIFLAGVAGLATALRALSLQTMQQALVLTLVLGAGGLLLLKSSNNTFIPTDRRIHEDRHLLGSWLNEHTPEDFTIGAFAVGSISYYAHDRNILDLFGLNDEVIAHSDVPNFGRGIPGHEKYNIEYVLGDVRPEIIVYAGADPAPVTTEQLKEQAATKPSPIEALSSLLSDPRLWEQYEIRSLQLKGRWFNFLQRRDTIAGLQAPGLQ